MNHCTEYSSKPLTVAPLTAISDMDLLIGSNGQSYPLDCLKSSHCLVSATLDEQFEKFLESSRRTLGPVMEEEPFRAHPFLAHTQPICAGLLCRKIRE